MTTAAQSKVMTTQQRFQRAREILSPSEVTLHQIPSWLSKKLRAYGKAHELEPSVDLILDHVVAKSCGSTLRWLDHWGTADAGPFRCCHVSSVFVSEPYDFGSETAKSLDSFCRALGDLEWHVSSGTWWNPGHTVRITIHEK